LPCTVAHQDLVQTNDALEHYASRGSEPNRSTLVPKAIGKSNVKIGARNGGLSHLSVWSEGQTAVPQRVVFGGTGSSD
jgi:hypothetical protein